LALYPFGAPDDHMIRAGETSGGDKFTSERPEAALHAVADDCAADLLGDREADAHRFVRILAVADKQDKSGRGHATAAIGGEEVGALLDGG
jgi:hypothetical protein